MCKITWPSGPRRWSKVPVRKGAGSNPAAIKAVDIAQCLNNHRNRVRRADVPFAVAALQTPPEHGSFQSIAHALPHPHQELLQHTIGVQTAQQVKNIHCACVHRSSGYAATPINAPSLQCGVCMHLMNPVALGKRVSNSHIRWFQHPTCTGCTNRGISRRATKTHLIPT